MSLDHLRSEIFTWLLTPQFSFNLHSENLPKITEILQGTTLHSFKFNLRLFSHQLKSVIFGYRSLTSVYNDLVESLNEKIVSYHFSTIATVVLHDVQSHHWINHKEFFEVRDLSIALLYTCSCPLPQWSKHYTGIARPVGSISGETGVKQFFLHV